MSAALSARTMDRTWRRQLDMCLTVLEDAHERGEHIVAPAVSARLRPFVPDVVTGMPIAQALDVVFRAQDDSLQTGGRDGGRGTAGTAGESDVSWLTEPGAGPRGGAGPAPEPLDSSAARALTERIKSAANNLSLLLLEAQEGQACVALGYRTWERYVRQEFGLSRTRSYELLDHGRLIRAIQATTGLLLMEDIPPYAARKVKPYLGQFIAALRSRVEGKPAEEVRLIVSDVIRNARPPVRMLASREPETPLSDRVIDAVAAPSPGRRATPVDTDVVWAVIEYLSFLPPAADVAGRLPATRSTLPAVERAMCWLSDLADQLRAGSSTTGTPPMRRQHLRVASGGAAPPSPSGYSARQTTAGGRPGV